LVLGVALAAEFEEFTNQKVTRRIDATTQVVKQTVSIDYKGSSGSYHLTLLHPNKIAHLNVTDSASKELTTTYVSEEQTNGLSYGSYRVQVPSGGGKMKVVVTYTGLLTPFPEKIGQNDNQLVLLEDNHYWVSPYPTAEQTTTVTLSSDRVESKSEQSPTSASGKKITYGPYNNVKPFTSSPLKVHYENNTPFLTVRKFLRTVEISHWGNVAVEDSFHIVHTGALLKTSFNRAEYQRNPNGAPAHVAKMKMSLPTGTADVYYRDNIGNISTSNFNEFSKPPRLEFQPRTMLFGGWKIIFEIGFNLPSEKYLSRSSDDSSRYTLSVPFLAQLEDVTYEDAEILFILPEGTKNAEVTAPFTSDTNSTGRHYTYLDTSGRQTLRLSKRNVLAEGVNRNIQVTYHFSRSSLFQEPILLISTWFAFFVLIMGVSRFRFQIGKPVVRSVTKTQ